MASGPYSSGLRVTMGHGVRHYTPLKKKAPSDHTSVSANGCEGTEARNELPDVIEPLLDRFGVSGFAFRGSGFSGLSLTPYTPLTKTLQNPVKPCKPPKSTPLKNLIMGFIGLLGVLGLTLSIVSGLGLRGVLGFTLGSV